MAKGNVHEAVKHGLHADAAVLRASCWEATAAEDPCKRDLERAVETVSRWITEERPAVASGTVDLTSLDPMPA